MTSFLSDKSIFKSLVAAGVAASIDIVIYKNNNYKATALLASTVGTSSYVSSKLILPDVTGTQFDTSFMESSTLQQRILELTLSSGSSFVLSKYVLKNMRELPMMQYIGIFGGSSLISEYIADYVFKEALSYLS